MALSSRLARFLPARVVLGLDNAASAQMKGVWDTVSPCRGRVGTIGLSIAASDPVWIASTEASTETSRATGGSLAFFITGGEE